MLVGQFKAVLLEEERTTAEEKRFGYLSKVSTREHKTEVALVKIVSGVARNRLATRFVPAVMGRRSVRENHLTPPILLTFVTATSSIPWHTILQAVLAPADYLAGLKS